MSSFGRTPCGRNIIEFYSVSQRVGERVMCENRKFSVYIKFVSYAREKNRRYARNYALCVLCDKNDISFVTQLRSLELSCVEFPSAVKP